MKIIDLLNKIANREEVPTYIRYINFVKNKEDIMMVCKENIIYKLDQLEIHLNDEVEILEEKKIPEKIEEKEIEISMAIGEQICANKINEIIDYLEHLKSKGDE